MSKISKKALKTQIKALKKQIKALKKSITYNLDYETQSYTDDLNMAELYDRLVDNKITINIPKNSTCFDVPVQLNSYIRSKEANNEQPDLFERLG